ncbi:MFS transporter [Bifidobacterium sp. SMB2]|uniref:MFS transporter n=1 Tax=Bifidobacterium saimiriisciurei TaxID=2661627 RepID=A0ABX0CEH5_9BIFI|nr:MULTISPECIES: MFS transporter [Bifidobacterium]NEG96150.1 MFS transporter [Bifidobacterium sp. SMB2]NEH10772.1 MFS transporter [Bifidobacterium saimiriisciurei]
MELMDDKKQRGLRRSLICLCAAETVMMINTTAFNVALPSISESFAAGTDAQQWIVSSYNLVFAAVVLLAGFAGDRIGYARTMIAGLWLFVVASVIGILAGNIPTLLVSRALMGAGAGIVIPMGQALLSLMFQGGGLSGAMTAWAIAGTLGVPFGPLVGGVLTATLGWRGIFGFDGVVFLVVIVLVWASTSRGGVSRRGGKLQVPWASVAMMFAGFSLFSAGLVNAQHGFLALTSWAPMLGGLVLIAGFVLHDRASRNPLMELGLMRDRSFAACAPALMMLNFSMYGIIFIMPAYLETVLRHGVLVGGLMLTPLVVASIVGSLSNGHIASRIGLRGTSLLALAFLATGMAVMGIAMRWHGDIIGQAVVAAGQLLAGFGLGAGQPAMLTWAMGRVPNGRSGAGSSLLTVFRQFGSIIGVGIFGSVQGGLYVSRFHDDALAAGLAADSSAGSVTLDFQWADGLASTSAEALRQVASDAYETAMLGSFVSAAVVIVATLAIVAILSGGASRSARQS